MPVCLSQNPLPHKLAANAACLVTIGPIARTNDSVAITKVLTVMAFDEVDISLFIL